MAIILHYNSLLFPSITPSFCKTSQVLIPEKQAEAAPVKKAHFRFFLSVKPPIVPVITAPKKIPTPTDIPQAALGVS